MAEETIGQVLKDHPLILQAYFEEQKKAGNPPNHSVNYIADRAQGGFLWDGFWSRILESRPRDFNYFYAAKGLPNPTAKPIVVDNTVFSRLHPAYHDLYKQNQIRAGNTPNLNIKYTNGTGSGGFIWRATPEHHKIPGFWSRVLNDLPNQLHAQHDKLFAETKAEPGKKLFSIVDTVRDRLHVKYHSLYLANQKRVGNTPNLSVGYLDGKSVGGFSWHESPEEDIICNFWGYVLAEHPLELHPDHCDLGIEVEVAMKAPAHIHPLITPANAFKDVGSIDISLDSLAVKDLTTY